MKCAFGKSGLLNKRAESFSFLVLLVFLLLVGWGCGKKSVPDVSEVEVNFNLIPFYEELFAIPSDSVAFYVKDLKETYGQYLEAYCQGVIRVGSPRDPEFPDRLASFLSYEPNAQVLDTCLRVFSDKEALHNSLTRAFRFYQYYFPSKRVPDVYLHISGFNQSVVIDSGWVSVSVEKYLGCNNPFYEWLTVPLYLRKGMEPQRLVPDVVKAIGMTEFPFNDSVNDLISHMVYQGKILHFVKNILPDISEPLLFGYTQQEYDWCMRHEATMWKSMVEKKHLFSTDPMLVRKYVGEAPFTSMFGQDSPGGAGCFVGYMLLDSWLHRHPKKNMVDLMSVSDAHKILAEAGYRP